MIKKIVIIGPESTGKSSLCEQLAEHYHTIWIREYAREYLLKNGTAYNFENLLDIAKGQVQLEELAVESWQLAGGSEQWAVGSWQGTMGNEQWAVGGGQGATGNEQQETSNKKRVTRNEQQETINPKPIFFDTDLYVLKVWCEFVFEKCHHWILNRIVERKYDLYLLCNIDLPWVKDELREYPDLVIRQKLYHHYKDIMINQNVPWVDISGGYEERLAKAVRAVDGL